MKKYLFMAMVAIAGMLSGCGPKTEEVVNGAELQGIKIRPSEVTLEEGDSVKLHVRYVPEEAEATAPAVQWYSEKQRVASVDENGNVKADRVGTTVITAQCGKFEAKCTVEVTKLELPTPEPDPEINFSLSTELIQAPAKGGTFDITVTTDTTWKASCERSWAKLSQTEGKGNATVQVTVDPADSESTLTQKITFKVGKGTYYVTIQRKGMQFSISPETIDVPSKGGTFTINVTSNIAWTASCEETWAKLDKTSGDGDATVSVTVDAANTESATSQKIVFKAGGNTYNVTIKRDAKAKLSIDKREINVPVTGGSYTINVNTNREWDVKEKTESGIVTITKSGNQAIIKVAKNIRKGGYVYNRPYYVGSRFDIPIIFSAEKLTDTLTLKVEEPYIYFSNVTNCDWIAGTYGKHRWTDESHDMRISKYYIPIMEEIAYGTGVFTYEATLKSNIDWVLDIEDTNSSFFADHGKRIYDFVSSSVTKGKGNATIKITADTGNKVETCGSVHIYAVPDENAGWSGMRTDPDSDGYDGIQIYFIYTTK